MSSPHIKPPVSEDSWTMNAASIEANIAFEDENTASRHENGDAGDGEPTSDDPSPLLPSKEAGGPDLGIPGAKPGTIYREKQIKPNKVYVGGLPEHTRQEDLQSCFGKIGRIESIELKVGFGFVEFADRHAAEESVAKYHEGYFMGNKIRVELSHGGGRTAKFPGEPGACFKCGQMGHWARECPNHVITVGNRKPEGTLLDRVSHPPRELPPPPVSRDYPPYRDDYRAPPPPPVRDSRYGYDYPPPPNREPRDYRPRDFRPLTPPREYRDYPAGGPPPPRFSRDADDYRRDYRGPPPPVAPPRYDSRPGYYPDVDYRPGYAPPPRDPYDSRGGYDKRSGPPPPADRYPPYPPPSTGGRPRTPPRGRDDYDKPPPPRDYPPLPDYRGRPATPPPSSRYPDVGRSGGPNDGPPGSTRYRRRSQSPLARSGPSYPPGPPPPPIAYSSAPPYPPPAGSFASGYNPGAGGPPPGRTHMGSVPRDRDYPPRVGRDSGDSVPYARRP